ncbi:hypothetical protein ACFE35_20280 [Phormidesmis priestleyi ANT.L61.2]
MNLTVGIFSHLAQPHTRELSLNHPSLLERNPGEKPMEEWQKDFSELLETIADHIEGFFVEVSREVTEVVNVFVEISEELSEQAQNTFTDEFDQYITELVNPVLEAYFGFEGMVGEAAQPMMQTVEPLLNQHPVCVGCRHYHGQAYGGNVLVCGMHPYGVGEGLDTCADKELTRWKSPYLNSEGQFLFREDEW